MTIRETLAHRISETCRLKEGWKQSSQPSEEQISQAHPADSVGETALPSMGAAQALRGGAGAGGRGGEE